MLQHQLRNRADAQLNLIPMIDILTVMVSFLLVYSTNVEVLQNTRAIQIPQSISEQQPRQTVVVMLTLDELYVQGEPITTVAAIRAGSSDIIAPLSAALDRPLLGDQRGAQQDPLATRDHGHGRQGAAVRGAQEGHDAPAPMRTMDASRSRSCRRTSPLPVGAVRTS